MSTERDRPPTDGSPDQNPATPGHAAAEGAERHPLIDLSRDPRPGVPDHAKPDED